MTKAKTEPRQKTPLTFLVLMFALVCAFAIYGCGGGGGGGGGAAVMPTPDPMPGGGQQMPGTGTGGMTGGGTNGGSSSQTRARMLTGISALPATVTSSIVDDFILAADRFGAQSFVGTKRGFKTREFDGVTYDPLLFTSDPGDDYPLFFLTAEYDNNGQLHFSRVAEKFLENYISSSTEEDSVTFNRLDGVPGAGWKGVEVQAEDPAAPNRITFWDAFSDIENARDTDYLVLGYWVNTDKAPASDGDIYTHVGFSAAGIDSFISANYTRLTGTANYEGPATGIFINKTNANATPDVDNFNATAHLTADFGDANTVGTVTGSITRGMTDSGVAVPELNFGDVLFGTSVGSRFAEPFIHDLIVSASGSIRGVTDKGGTLSGRWLSQFYGNSASATDHPGSVAGIFDAKTEDDSQAILGAFGAYKQ